MMTGKELLSDKYGEPVKFLSQYLKDDHNSLESIINSDYDICFNRGIQLAHDLLANLKRANSSNATSDKLVFTRLENAIVKIQAPPLEVGEKPETGKKKY